MHTSCLQSLSLLALFAARPILAQDIDTDEIPSQCSVVCQNLPAVSGRCDQLNENDSDETQCVCSATNAQLIIPLCAACVSQYGSDGADNDVNDLVSACSFTTTSFNPDITFSLPSLVVVQSITNSGTTTTTSSSTSSATSNSGSTTASAQPGSSAFSAGSSAIQSGTTATGNAVSTSTDGAAAPTANAGQGVHALAGAALLAAAAWL